MGFAFDETMAGTFERVDAPGDRHPFKFRARIHARSFFDHLRTGKAEMTGEVDAPPLARAAEFHGEITLRPLLGRVIRYRFDFTGDDGKPYTFTGQKDIRWTDLVDSWTHLPGELRDDRGRLIATCQTRFDLGADWLSFLSSFRPT
jgi:hypothetical protein